MFPATSYFQENCNTRCLHYMFHQNVRCLHYLFPAKHQVVCTICSRQKNLPKKNKVKVYYLQIIKDKKNSEFPNYLQKRKFSVFFFSFCPSIFRRQTKCPEYCSLSYRYYLPPDQRQTTTNQFTRLKYFIFNTKNELIVFQNLIKRLSKVIINGEGEIFLISEEKL